MTIADDDAGSPRIRRARSAVIDLGSEGALGRNWFTRRATAIDAIAFAMLERLADWCAVDTLLEPRLPEAVRAEIAETVLRLIDADLVVVAGTEAAEIDAQLEREWDWGATAGLFHFGIHDPDYLPPHLIASHVAARLAATADVELCAPPAPTARALERPDPTDPLFAMLRRRRSRRTFADEDVAHEAFSSCLFAGFAVVGFGTTAEVDGERLPLGLAPSGGARHPFEAYVCVRRVAGLSPGVYRYCGLDHSLSVVDDAPPPDLATLLGGQTWFADAGALVLFVAHFRRTQRKYPHPGGLRVVLLEAGHIAQNVLLAAAAHGLVATPTCAVSDRALETICRLDPVTQAVVHVVAIGARSTEPSGADFPRYEENPQLPGWLGGVGS